MLKEIVQIALGVFGIIPGNYSGISHVRDNLYVVVDDKDSIDGFKFLTLDIDTVSGKLHNASIEEPSGLAERRRVGDTSYRDCEGVAFFPDSNTVFVSGEEDQRIIEYTIDGNPTGREFDIPEIMSRKNIAPNCGFEALSYNSNTKLFWTTTETMLPADGSRSPLTTQNSSLTTQRSSSAGSAFSAENSSLTTQNLLRLVCFDTSLKPISEYLYTMDLPTNKKTNVQMTHGVPSILALDDGSLIVMEREACVTKKKYGSWVEIKLYHVTIPAVSSLTTQNSSLTTQNSSLTTQNTQKKLLYKFTTHLRLGKMNFSNYEGMTLGPRLADGSQTLILISDSQNGIGNFLYHLKDNIKIIKCELP